MTEATRQLVEAAMSAVKKEVSNVWTKELGALRADYFAAADALLDGPER